MNNLAITYQDIADILSFEVSNSQLETKISNPSFDWDAIVREGSKHVVIPAIYCRLKIKQLLHLLPQELINYFEYVTTQNRNRNIEIYNQTLSISQLFNKNNIKYVFVKGSALLVLGCFEDNAERMIGDIDILVDTDQLDFAYQLLQDNGYESIEPTLGNDFFEHKHLPRLISKNHIAAVEIHRRLFGSYKYKPLLNKSIFNDIQEKNHINIPSNKHLLMHNILNFQINDYGALYNSISFKSAYDTIVLQQSNFKFTEWQTNRIFIDYFRYTSLFFNDIKIVTKVESNIFTSFYLFKLKHIKFYKIWNKLLKICSILPGLIKRIWFFIFNKAYRRAIFKDRDRIYTYFMSILNKKNFF